MIRFEKQINANILDIKELRELREQESKIRFKNSYYNKKKLLQKYQGFFDFYINYCKSNLNQKKYAQNTIAQVVFKQKLKSKAHWNEYLIKSLYLSSTYVEYLKEVVNIKNIKAFDHTLTNLQIDLEWLVIQYEVDVKKTVNFIYQSSARSRSLTPTDLFFAAKSLFRIEEYKNVEKLYLRDLKPVVMFQIRQLLEVYGRELIGYYSINDKKGNPLKKFTQESWKFIKEEIKSPQSRIKLPFDIHMIIDINNWANNFVHTTYLHSSYIQYFALNALKVLFTSKQKGIKIFTGEIITKSGIADIEINNYNSLKTDFETYLNNLIPDTKVEWLNEKKVGAYIISL